MHVEQYQTLMATGVGIVLFCKLLRTLWLPFGFEKVNS